jgi:DNA invertase Pin-like site-specific DNA recombinase
MKDKNGNNGGRTIGYARVSTAEQDLKLQLDALKKHDVPKDLIFTDKASASKEDRQGLEACLAELRERQGPPFVVTTLSIRMWTRMNATA